MKLLIHFGKALLMIVFPIAFAIVSSIIISAMFACISVLMGHNTFCNSFQAMLGNVTFVMSIISLIMWVIYLSSEYN
jgi:hypothetical protein